MSESLIGNFFDLLADQLAPDDWQSSRAERAEEALDGLQLYGAEAVEYARWRALEEPTKENIASAWLIADACGSNELATQILTIDPKSMDAWQGIRLGLRLTAVTPWLSWLQKFLSADHGWAQVTAIDVLLFHRYSVACDVSAIAASDDPQVRCILLEALGRSRSPAGWRLSGQSVEAFLQGGLKDTDPMLRLVALRAAARAGLPGLLMHCRKMSVSDTPCLNAIRFLGVLAEPVDHALLRKLSSHERTAAAAVEAMGNCGAAELIPDVLQALSTPSTAQAAAQALERISGRSVPRQDPPSPPEHLTEEELDFWSEPGEPIPEAAHQWWHDNHYYFEEGHRYQSGRCVSDDPLGPVWHELSDTIRRDLYLRQRALAFNETPDWELETWAKCRF